MCLSLEMKNSWAQFQSLGAVLFSGLFYSMCMDVLPACMYMYHMYALHSMWSEEGSGCSGLKVVSSHVGTED